MPPHHRSPISATTLTTSIPLVIIAGTIISLLSFGPRSTMGFFLTPMTTAYGWDRETFALAIAVQNLVWGAAQPFTGMLADRYGTARVLTGGALVYALGMVLMAYSTNVFMLELSAGLLIGLGIAGSTFTIVGAAFARLLPAEMRTIGFGIGAAAGSFGQFLFAPLGQGLITGYGWQVALIVMGGTVLLIPFLSYAIRGKPAAVAARPGEKDQSILEALREAFGHNSYRLLVAGFFVCGFHIAFITVHLPAYLSDIGIPALYGGYALALIGLFNIIGSLGSGVLSGRMPKRILLAAIYLARSVAIALFITLPPSVPATLIFAAVIGLLWLSTVPPTQQLVAIMFGTRYLATLFGFVFFSHQVGSFLGVWLGGILYDRRGSYDVVWWMSVALGVFAAIVHLPIRETGVARPAIATGY